MRIAAVMLLPLLTTIAWADDANEQPAPGLDVLASPDLSAAGPDAVLETVDRMVAAGESAVAHVMLRSAIARQPGHAPFRVRLGRLHYDAGAYAEAVTSFGDAARLGGLTAAGYVYYGHSHLALGEGKQAKDVYLAGVAAHPASEVPIRGGLLHLAGGDWESIEPLLREAVESVPTSRAATYLLGFSLVSQERWDDAVAALAQAASLGAPAANVQGLLGWVQEKRGRNDEAYAAYREALRADSGADHAASRMDELLQARGRPIDELRSEYDELLELAPRNPWIRNNYGYQLRQAAERMWAMVPGAETELSRSLLERSGEVYTEVSEMLPDDPQIQSDTGLVFEYYPCVRDHERARKHFTRALELTGWVYRDALNGMIRLCDRSLDWATLHEVTSRALAAFDGGAAAVVPAGADGAARPMDAKKTRVVRGGVELAHRAALAHLRDGSPLSTVPPLDLDLAGSFDDLVLPKGWQLDPPDSAPRGDLVTLRYAFAPDTSHVLSMRQRGVTTTMGKASRHDFTTLRRIEPTGPTTPAGDQPARVGFETTVLGNTHTREYHVHIGPDGRLVPGTVRMVPEAQQSFAEITRPLFTTLFPLPVLPVRVGETWAVPIEPLVAAVSRIPFERATLHAEAYQTLAGFESVDGVRCARIEMTWLAAFRSSAFVIRAGGASPGEGSFRGTAVILLGEDGRIRRIESEQEQRLEVRDAMQPLTVTVEENEHITVTGSIEP